MSKVQKNCFLAECVAALIDKHEEETGASFPRLVVASLLCYTFERASARDNTRPAGHNHNWIKYASRIQRGDMTIDDVAKEIGVTLTPWSGT